MKGLNISSRLVGTGIVVVLLSLAGCGDMDSPTEFADTVLVGGRVVTLDRGRPEAEALAILEAKSHGDASIKLAKELIAAILNVEQGADDAEALDLIAAAKLSLTSPEATSSAAADLLAQLDPAGSGRA